jgi:DNA-binding YbaB/EbfC family protein
MDSFQQQAQELLTIMNELQEFFEKKEVSGISGAGLVKIVLNCKYEVKMINIDKNLLVPDDVKILEDLITAAFNDAKQKIESIIAEESSKMPVGLPKIPGLPF